MDACAPFSPDSFAFNSYYIGIAGDILFRTTAGLGANQTVYFILLVGVVLGMAQRFGVPLNRRNRWLLLPLIVFAVLLMVRSSTSLLVFNWLMLLFLGALALVYLFSTHIVDEDATTDYFDAAVHGASQTAILPLPLLFSTPGIL